MQGQIALDWDHASSTSGLLQSEVAFASPEAQEQRGSELLGEGALVVRVDPPPALVRGALHELLDDLVERELTRLGAPSPYLAAWSTMPDDADARLSDQLFRARTVGATGIAFLLGSLAGIARPSLTPEDSATLTWLARAAKAAPLVLLVDDGDTRMLGYADPLPLATLLTPLAPFAIKPPRPMPTGTPTQARTEAPIPPAPELAPRHVRVTIPDLAIAPNPVAEVLDTGAPSPHESTSDLEVATTRETGETRETRSEATPDDVATPLAATADDEARAIDVTEFAKPVDEALGGTTEPAPPVAIEAQEARDAEETHEAQEARDVPAVQVEAEAEAPPTKAATRARRTTSADPANTRTERRDSARRKATAGVAVSGPNDAWRTWAIALAAARGPQPLSNFERLFAESYVPLANAIASGVDDTRAVRSYEEFRRTFERSYTDASATFALTNRRPKLVMDAFELAAKQARLHNARSAQVVIVDSLRFDLGCAMREHLTVQATGLATLTAESLLWSVLPTTTIRQLETIARGMDAIRAPAAIEEPAESLRGRTAEMIRRIRVGSRELFKLDVVPAMLDAQGREHVPSFEEIAETVGDLLLRHIKQQAPRTLVYVVGDHGFTLDRRGQIRTGGASPEEVLVPAQAWLVGDVH